MIYCFFQITSTVIHHTSGLFSAGMCVHLDIISPLIYKPKHHHITYHIGRHTLYIHKAFQTHFGYILFFISIIYCSGGSVILLMRHWTPSSNGRNCLKDALHCRLHLIIIPLIVRGFPASDNCYSPVSY